MKALLPFVLFVGLLPLLPAGSPPPGNAPKTFLAPGLSVQEFPRHPKQDNNQAQFFVEPDELGKPIGESYVVDSLFPWRWNGERNAIARGFIRVPANGIYSFTADSFYDRNLLIIDNTIVCGFRDGTDAVATITLKEGNVPILSYGVVESRGSTEGIRIRWKPPGQTELSPIPPDLLCHTESETEHLARLAATKPHANYLITAADDFIIEAYQNGAKIPLPKRKLLEERHGATVERINIETRPGDWLVFQVANNRLRWGGARYFAVAGMVEPNDFGFVSDPASPEWSACDDPALASDFIHRRDHGITQHADAITKVWADGDGLMRQFAGAGFPGKALWGKSATTWIKYVAPAAPVKPVRLIQTKAEWFGSGTTLLATPSFQTPEPPMKSFTPKRWPVQILSAIYGSGGKDADVTAVVKEMVEVKQRPFTICPADLGTDPNPNWNKVLHIVYMKDGARRDQQHSENERVFPESFYGPQDVTELTTYLSGTRWIGEGGEVQFHADHSLTRPGPPAPQVWQALSNQKIRITWDADHQIEYAFDATWESFQGVENKKQAFHLMR